MTSFIRKLEDALGPDSVLSSPASRLLYSYDAALDKNLPCAAVLPRSIEDLSAAVRLAREAGVPFVARGAGTNLCGGSVPAEGGLVIHLARMNRILGVDTARRRVLLEPGVVNLQLQKALAERGFFYAPDPASQKACTLGGNVGTNAGGPHCLKHGVTTNHVTALQMVLPSGEIARVSIDDPGCDLTGLFVGSEGTLGIAAQIELNILPLPEDVRTFLAAFPSMEAAVQTVTDIVSAGVVPTALEVMDRVTVDAVEAFLHAGYPRGAEAVLLIELDGDREKMEAASGKIRALCGRNGCPDVRQARDAREREKLWEGRRGSYPAMARLAPNVLVEDGVVPRTKLPEAVRRIRAIAARDNIRMGLIAHAGDGNLHPNMVFDERDAEETARVKAAGREMMRVCVDLGGSISGEHGIGVDKRDAMRWLFTPDTLDLFRRIKQALDPDNLCNPDKLIPLAEEGADGKSGVDASGDAGVVQSFLRRAHEEKRPVFVRGLGTKFTAPLGSSVLEMSAFNKIIDHDRDNFTLTVQAGATLAQLAPVLAAAGQYLHLAGEGTLGGILSSRASRLPRARDQVLGLKALLADGTPVEFGAKVMKNVAGYDVLKLFLGAWGAFGVIHEVTLRLYPFPAEAAEGEPRPSPDFSSQAALHGLLKRVFDPEGILNPGVLR